MLLNYGYQGIMSVIDALLTRHDVVVYDKDNHASVSYTHLRAHETVLDLVCRLLLEKKTT